MAINPLRLGDTGDMVKAMQLALIVNGYTVGAGGATGTFDDTTLRALESFQGDAGVPVQPSCDNASWSALGPSK
jgi:peptidoglycan hydrolase-like protein with peptidoglycan-binding domain